MNENNVDVEFECDEVCYSSRMRIQNEPATTTLVTALYDLKRGSMKREANNYRPFDNYLKWFKQLLTVHVPLVIYIPPTNDEYYPPDVDLKRFIEMHRSVNYQTKIIVKPFHKLLLYRELDRIKNVMVDLPKRGINMPNLEFHVPEYVILIFSKFEMLAKAAEDNYFNTQYFGWIDAGYIRRDLKTIKRDLTVKWPDKYKADIMKDKFLVQNISININADDDKSDSKITLAGSDELTDLTPEERAYLKRIDNQMLACFFGGSSKQVMSIKRLVYKMFHIMLSYNLINNEQQVLSLLIKRNPDYFLLYPPGGDNRCILEDLAVGGVMKVPYAVHPKVKVLSVVTCNIEEQQFKRWSDSLTYFGYNYEVLGRGECWRGWDYRTQTYLSHLKQLPLDVEIAILSDATDIIFVAPAIEAYQKFKQSKTDALIGTEYIIAYSNGKYDRYKIEDFFIKPCQTRFCFPNGGFVIGRVSKLIEILEKNKFSKDDQAGYMDLLYEDPKIGLDLDTKTNFIGNVPNLNTFTHHERKFWKYDPLTNRYYNSVHGTYPIAFHFPGGNYRIMNEFHNQIFPDANPVIPVKFNNNWFWIIIVVIIAILVIILIVWYLRRKNNDIST